MGSFVLIWCGQLVSLIGSALTSFALGVWLYQHTGSTTLFSLFYLFVSLPFTLASPIAGVLVDRWDRRLVMIVSDSGAALCTVAIAFFLLNNHLNIWLIYPLTALISIFGAFQVPAYIAATTQLVPKQSLDRANGMIELADAVSSLIAPILAGYLLGIIQLSGIIIIDFVSFFISILTLSMVSIPRLKTVSETSLDQNTFIQEALDGWNYIASRPGLLGLLLYMMCNNFIIGLVLILLTPLVLSFSSAESLGTISSMGGIGMLLGGILFSLKGGSQRQIYALFTFVFLGGLSILIGGLRASVLLIGFASFLGFFGIPIINSASQVIFQKKSPLHLQGRIFSFYQMGETIALPVAAIIAGPLADQIFEPLMTQDGVLANSIGQIIGLGKGRGIGLLFIVMGLLMMLITLLAYCYRPLRLVEDDLPDAIN
ncbi:MFS transporter [Aphanothece hegewaldii CCALA 016]|uniref:MFS transporter n=1 Tax=Aphanothece hegewaldii CCALA 016 TaxID=2107694 RepID=A0A2T1LZK1_9CHRO|nr:MFS transporter [Aphanothece hegewaldii]PSF37822.1 MFS transporter [Aphanothece hegewaldii CCALA 016]